MGVKRVYEKSCVYYILPYRPEALEFMQCAVIISLLQIRL